MASPSNFKDMAGQRFGMLTVMSRNGNRAGNALWLCRCECGIELTVKGRALREGQYSCGCVRRTHGMYGSPVYRIWNAMVQRCTNKNQTAFNRYGGRGISVCERWKTFENFFADMGNPPPDHSIERRNNDGNYEPSNCCWLPKSKQAQNRRSTVFLEIYGEKVCLSEAARRFSISPSTALHRHNRGWSVDRILGLAA